MPFPSHLLTDVVLVSRYQGRTTDAFPEPIHGPWERVRCAFQESFQKVRDSDGNERISASNIATRARIGLEDRVILPPQNGVEPTMPAGNDDERAVTPLAFRNDRSRISGFRMHQTFF